METQLPDSFIHVGGYRRVAPQQIVRLVADRNYTLIHEVSGRKFLVSTTMKVLEGRLRPYGFVRLTRGVVVNRRFVAKVWKDGIVQLTDGTQICPSRRRQGVLKTVSSFMERILPQTLTCIFSYTEFVSSLPDGAYSFAYVQLLAIYTQ